VQRNLQNLFIWTVLFRCFCSCYYVGLKTALPAILSVSAVLYQEDRAVAWKNSCRSFFILLWCCRTEKAVVDVGGLPFVFPVSFLVFFKE